MNRSKRYANNFTHIVASRYHAGKEFHSWGIQINATRTLFVL